MKLRIIARLLAAQALSSIGTSMSTVALAVMVFKLTGSVLQMGGIMAASTVPLVLTAWVGGAFLDRYSARNLMILADVARAVLIFCMPILAGRNVGLVYLVAALIGIFSGLFNPGQVKLVGEIVEPGQLVRANSYLGVSRDGPELAGYLVGGVVASISGVTLMGVQITGYTLAFTIDAVSYAASALMLVGLPRGAVGDGAAARLGTLVAESPGVLAKLWRAPALRTNLLLAVFGVGAMMMNMPLSYGLALEVFDRGPVGLATLEVFVAVGLIVGGLLFSRARLEREKNGYVFTALVIMAVFLVGVGLSGDFWLAITLMGLGGVASVGLVVPSITMFQEIPPAPHKGRLIALRSSFGQLGTALGFALGGLLGDEIGIRNGFLVTGAIMIGIGALVFIPYRLGAARRSKQAWIEATQAGKTRTAAREWARQVAYSGLASGGGGLGTSGAGTAAWAALEAGGEAERAAAAGDGGAEPDDGAMSEPRLPSALGGREEAQA